MRILRSSNPVFRGIKDGYELGSEAATYSGITSKTLFLFLITLTTGFIAIMNLEYIAGNNFIMFGSMILALVCVIGARVNPKRAKIFAPLYAALEGIVLGVLIIFVESIVPGIAFNAILITISIFLVMLVLYGTGAVRVGPMFRRVMMGALIGLLVFTLTTFLIGLISPEFKEAYFANMETMLMVSLISAALASLFILIDLDNCSKLVKAGAPKEYEWIASLGLMVTIIWLFIEILRILLIFAGRRK